MIVQLGNKLIIPQWLAGIGVTVLMIHVGFMGGWASPTLVRLSASDSTIKLTPDQASWVASLLNFGRFFGGILGAIAAYFLGSKRAILATTAPLALGWLAIVVADNVEWLYISRMFSGVGLGMAFATFPLYIGEVSMPEIRGALISLAIVGAPFGQIVASISGSYLSPSNASLIYLALAFLLSGLFLWLPESPYHLLKIRNREAAKTSINWYRAGREVEAEMETVERFILADGTKTLVEKFQEFRNPSVRKATVQIIFLFTFAQWCGLNIIMYFMESILIKAKFTLTDPYLVVIYANIFSIFSAAISMFLIDRCGRKFLIVISSIGTTIAMVGLTVHFTLIDLNVDVMNVQWLPMTSMFLFMFSYFMGLLSVPSTILGEIFPTNIKCVAACIAILTGAASSFISAKTYQPMVNILGDIYVFMIYTILSAIVIPYAIFFVPETKGKSLQEIQIELTTK